MIVWGWKLEAGGWRLEVGGWRLEVGGWRLEAGGWRGIVPSALDPFVLANFTPYKCFHLLLFGPIYTDFLQAAPVVFFYPTPIYTNP